MRDNLIVNNVTGQIADNIGYVSTDAIDLQGGIIAPGFIELQTNGMRGFHFTHFEDPLQYANALNNVAQYLPSTGVTSFYVTIPTVASEHFKKILPSLSPRHVSRGASILGAHAEGPYLCPSKKGAHNADLFHVPSTPPIDVYGPAAESCNILKLVTIAPELDDSAALVRSLTSKGIVVSLGHSNASYDTGMTAIKAGAACLTHTLNAMAPLHHRDPGLAGLVTASSSTAGTPFFSIIPDGNHLHPSVATMLFHSNPTKCILITDSTELAGLEDGTYPGHSQIPFNQTKVGNRVVIETTQTLIGGCADLSECVSNLIEWSGCTVAEAVRCVTENIVDLMGDGARGKLESGRRADFVVLNNQGHILQTWVAGQQVYNGE